MRALCAAAALAATLAAAARADDARPPALRDVGYDQRLGESVPPDLAFRDETGRPVTLREYLGHGPVILVPAYYRCPMLCPLVLNGLASALRAVSFDAGREFTVVAFSFDPTDTSASAAERKASVLADYRRPGAAAGWHFLTGDATAVAALTRAIGFRYAWDAAHAQFAHATGVVVLTPGGTIARYFFGVEFAPKDLRLALVDASAGRIGTVVDQLLLFCFHWDPATGRYSRVALGAVRAGGAVTLLVLGGFVVLMLRRERRGEA
ncbi:MAG TPA: SCO family protein [Candidatus Binatia bacterium]|nr:SCO family protein [Candidatus Binatia bacterium]